MNLRLLFPATFVVALLLLHCSPSPDHPFEEIAQQSLPPFQLEEGFEIELIAAEPLVADPVAMEVDERGHLYVVEMPGYPLDVSKTGKIKRLKDTDGDGFPDESVIFAEDLTLPTGIMRWKHGFLVTDAPDVLFLADTTGDDIADVREVVLTGFALSNPQHNMNTPIYGLDNWIYLANEYYISTENFDSIFGDKGSEVHYPSMPAGPKLPPNADDRNVRFKPDTYELEQLAGKTQYGHTFTPWGHHLLTSNATPLFHEVIQARYLERNPKLLITDATQYLPAYQPASVYPITEDPQHQLLTDVGVITSACGINWYKGGNFPEVYDSVVFVAEPVHNLIQANRLLPKGATFEARHLLAEREFLASTDSWFRPVFNYVGPDGALYVVDYYRKIVEHPEWMSDEVNASGELYHGTDKGRIYRISPKGSAPMSWLDQLSLDIGSPLNLVQTLENPNIWWRRHAQRLLVDRKEPSSRDALMELVKTTESALGRVHALWTLEGLDWTDPVILDLALKDAHPGVRENAIKLAELHLDEFSVLLRQLFSMAQDPDPKVRYQLLCTLGNTALPEANKLRLYLLNQDIDDPWVQLATLSALPGAELATLEYCLEQWADAPSEGRASFIQRLSALIALNGNEAEVQQLLSLGTTDDPAASWYQAACLQGLGQGLARQSTQGLIDGATRSRLLSCAEREDAGVRTAALELLEEVDLPRFSHPVVQRAARTVTDPAADPALRADLVRLLAIANPLAYRATFQALIDPALPTAIQQAALQGLGQLPGTFVTEYGLGQWASLTPQLRETLVGVSLKSPDRMLKLLEGVEKKVIDPANIGWRRTVFLMNNDHEQVRTYARSLLASAFRSREDALKDAAGVLALTGNIQNGQQVFERVCASCHQLGGTLGTAFGPDLAAVRNRSKQSLLTDILMPNKSVADGYELRQLTLKDGSKLSGIIAEETANSLKLLQLDGKALTIERSELSALTTMSISAMPEGLESQMEAQEMADLLAFLRGIP